MTQISKLLDDAVAGLKGEWEIEECETECGLRYDGNYYPEPPKGDGWHPGPWCWDGPHPTMRWCRYRPKGAANWDPEGINTSTIY
jgi:hypothetical protein